MFGGSNIFSWIFTQSQVNIAAVLKLLDGEGYTKYHIPLKHKPYYCGINSGNIYIYIFLNILY